MHRYALIVSTFFWLANLGRAGEAHKVEITLDAARFSQSPEMIFEGGYLRLARAHFLTHELGNTDHHQTETLSASAWAKVHFHIDHPPKEDGELLMYGGAKEILVNGAALDAPKKVFSTGWSRATVPAKTLRKGVNEVVLRGGGQLLVEPTRPGRSFKSTDAGGSWSQHNLTVTGEVTGEYLVRLRLPQHAPIGWAVSPVVDLGPSSEAKDTPEVTLAAFPKLPAKTDLKVFVRFGSTPSPDEKPPLGKKGKAKASVDSAWTGWTLLDAKTRRVTPEPGQRWLQLKLVFESQDGVSSPSLPAVPLRIVRKSGPPVAFKHEPPAADLLGGLPFVYEKPSLRLDHLRKRYKLDEVIAPGKTEMEQFMLLRYWVRNQWHTAWKFHAAGWMPPWDALIILECKDQPECQTMCTHYAAVFTQCCQALGWNARHCILDHHCVSEVYSFEHDRWVMMDTGNSAKRADVGFHCERKGVPLSARELHLAFKNKELGDITVHYTPWRLSKKIQHLCREAPDGKLDFTRPDVIPLPELPKFPVCQVENFRRYAFPGRNNYLTTLYPGELYQGFSSYCHDGYWWVGDKRDAPAVSPEYSKHLDPERVQDIDWKLGGVRVFLSRTEKSSQVQADLESLMPNHVRFEIWNAGKSEWQATPATFTVSENVLRVRSVNHWGKAGRETRVTFADK